MVVETAMGIKINAQKNMNQSFIIAAKEQMDVITKRMFHIWLKPQWIFNLTSYGRAEKKNIKILHKFTEAIVRQKRLEYANREDKRKYSNIVIV